MVFTVLDLSLPSDESGETKFKIEPQLAELSSLKLYLQPPHSHSQRVTNPFVI
jgi:hypothetical protein